MSQLSRIPPKVAMIMLSIFFGFLVILGATGLLLSQSFLQIDHYPAVKSIKSPSNYPSFSVARNGVYIESRRPKFFSSASSYSEIGQFYNLSGWQPVGDEGRWWVQKTTSAKQLQVSHTSMMYEDYGRDGCPLRETCIFTKTSVLIKVPDWLNR